MLEMRARRSPTQPDATTSTNPDRPEELGGNPSEEGPGSTPWDGTAVDPGAVEGEHGTGGGGPTKKDPRARPSSHPPVYAAGHPPVPEHAPARPRSTSAPSRARAPHGVESPFRGGDPAAPMAQGYEVARRDAGTQYLTGDEREARRTVVRQFVSLGVGVDELPRAMVDQGWPMSRIVAKGEYDAVMAEWVADHEALRETTRVAQIRRLENDLVRYRAAEGAEEGTKGARTRWQAVVQCESLLARLQGHFAPTQHEVRVEATVVVRQALLDVVSGLTAEELDGILAEEDERERLLAEARRDRGALVVAAGDGQGEG